MESRSLSGSHAFNWKQFVDRNKLMNKLESSDCHRNRQWRNAIAVDLPKHHCFTLDGSILHFSLTEWLCVCPFYVLHFLACRRIHTCVYVALTFSSAGQPVLSRTYQHFSVFDDWTVPARGDVIHTRSTTSIGDERQMRRTSPTGVLSFPSSSSHFLPWMSGYREEIVAGFSATPSSVQGCIYRI